MAENKHIAGKEKTAVAVAYNPGEVAPKILAVGKGEVAERIIETAKANGLNVYTYLEYLLMYMPDTDWQNYPEELDYLMPWSEAVQAECK